MTPSPDLDLDLDLYEPDGQPFPDPREAGRAAPPAARLIPRQPPGHRAFAARPGPVPIGIRGGQEITADPAALGGLGLTGPGAPAAARAILAGLLARPPRGPGGTPAEIIIPAADAARLLPGPPGPRAHPPIRGVWVPPALDAALDEAEAMIVRRARTADHQDGPQTAAVLLAAAPGPADAQRLAGITGAGRDLGVAVILLGDWPHGTTCHITASGLISGVTPPEADLAGTQAYHLAAADLAAIIAQLDQARETPGDGPAAPGPPGPGQPQQPGTPAAPGPAPADAPRRPAQHPPPRAQPGQAPAPGLRARRSRSACSAPCRSPPAAARSAPGWARPANCSPSWPSTRTGPPARPSARRCGPGRRPGTAPATATSRSARPASCSAAPPA